MSKMKHVPYGPYEKYIKRPMDFVFSLLVLVVLFPLLLVLTVTGAICMGGNPFFTQLRPGKDEKMFELIKFRSMNNKKGKDGQLLPDEQRLNKYGKFIRATSLDELPELINIIKGDMSIVGPRPQLVKDMVFMSVEQRQRYNVLPGLTGWAQVNGRNGITWEEKLELDLEYIFDINFLLDLKIIFATVPKIFNRDDISAEGMDTAEDFGEYLLRTGKIDRNNYDDKIKKIC